MWHNLMLNNKNEHALYLCSLCCVAAPEYAYFNTIYSMQKKTVRKKSMSKFIVCKKILSWDSVAGIQWTLYSAMNPQMRICEWQ